MKACELCKKKVKRRVKRRNKLVCTSCHRNTKTIVGSGEKQETEKSPAYKAGYKVGKKAVEGLAAKLKAQKKPADNAPHLIVEARAGTGKTTTLVEGLKIMKGMKSKFTPSPQQAAVWEAMKASNNAISICFVAFNKAIAVELQNRVPDGCNAMTMHSMGFKAIRGAFSDVKVNSYRVQDIISEILERDIRELRKWKMEVIKATEKLVGLCKQNLIDTNRGIGQDSILIELTDLAAHYDVDLNGNAAEVFALVPKVLERCKNVDRDHCIDFNDMIWLPVALGLTIFKYDLLLVDEAQDLNRCQQQLALQAGRRLILVGDPKQAIYGFAGADSESINRMANTLGATDRGLDVLPLTVTRRCGKAIVKEAQRLVPDFEAHETCCEGDICNQHMDPNKPGDYSKEVKNGDMLLCRCNAPLVQQCFRFLKAGRKANIQGRDIGQGLISTIKKMKASSVPDLVGKLSDWLHHECTKENAKRNPNESRLIGLQDRYDCLEVFCDGQTSVEGVIQKIETIFTDDKNGTGIMLSSVHKAKGLEANRVFLLQPEGASIPHPMAKSAWQREAEYNILYVAITRAREELIYVS